LAESQPSDASGDARRSTHRAALAYVCAYRDELAAELAPLPAAPDGRLPSTLVDGLLVALGAAGDYGSWLDAMDEALRRSADALGLYGRVGSEQGSRELRLAGGSSALPPTADETVYLCPAGYCSRFAFAEGGAPRCVVAGQPMREDRL
jgi:hypothetical protein